MIYADPKRSWLNMEPPIAPHPHSVRLPVHPDTKGTRDPRKVWCYDCISGKFVAYNGYDAVRSNHRVYYFESESDLMLFILRWM